MPSRSSPRRSSANVFVEKPFTLSKASAEAAVAACRAAGVVLALGHNRRFLPATAEMQRLLARARSAPCCMPRAISAAPPPRPGRKAWRADREENPLGGMGGMGIHMVDMLICLMGPFAEVTVQSLRQVSPHVDDTTAMLARFTSGATCTFATLSLAPQTWRVALYGTKGSLEMRGQQQLVFVPVPGEGEAWTKDYPKVDIEAAELAAFAAAVAGGPAYPLPLADAIHGVSVFETMIGAAASGSSYAVA